MKPLRHSTLIDRFTFEGEQIWLIYLYLVNITAGNYKLKSYYITFGMCKINFCKQRFFNVCSLEITWFSLTTPNFFFSLKSLFHSLVPMVNYTDLQKLSSRSNMIFRSSCSGNTLKIEHEAVPLAMLQAVRLRLKNKNVLKWKF